MAKVTGKFQITLPKAVVDRCGIRVGDELELRPIGRSIQIDRRTTPDAPQLLRERLAHFDRAMTRQRTRAGGAPAYTGLRGGRARNFTCVAALVDTNVLVYRFDPRFPDKQARATELLRTGISVNSIRLPHQALIEFIAATAKPLTRPVPTQPKRFHGTVTLDPIRVGRHSSRIAEEVIAQH
jgi:AbrB family looped-hinge helix DNA binding protein